MQEFGAELKLIVTQWKNGLKNAVNESKVAGKQMQDNLTVTPDYRGMNAQQVAEAYSKKTGKNAYVTDLNNALEQTNNTANKAGNSLGNMFLNAEKKGRRFILALFSIRSIWSLISRAASSYMSTNDELNQKVQLTAQIMGQMLAPIIKKVVDLAQYAVIILAKVIQLFTGYNALANITTKSLNGTAKASKNLSKSLASFDTITNLGDQTSGLSSDIGSSIKALDDFEQKVKDIEKLFKEHKGLIAGIGTALALVFGLSTLAKIKSVLGVLGTGATAAGASGLLGVLSVVGLLAAAAILIPIAVKGVKETIKGMKEVGKAIDTVTDGIDEQIESSKELTKKLKENADGTSKTSEETKKYNNWLLTEVESYKNLSKSYSDQKTWLVKISDWLGITDGAYKKLEDAEKKTKEASYYYTLELKKQYDAGMLSDDMINQYKDSLTDSIYWLEEQSSKLNSNSTEYKKNKEKVNELYGALEKVAGKDYTAKVKVNADTQDFKTKMKKLTTETGKKVLKSIIGIPLGPFSAWINAFDVGTNYVPNDQLAMIHKGEMIVPKKYNPATSNIGTGNDETNRLLNRLIVTLENKDMNAYISSNDVGRASVSYINEQSRIMGRKLI